jgi:hypothetical protein
MKVLKIGYKQIEGLTLLKNINDVRNYVDNYAKSTIREDAIGDVSGLCIEAQSTLLKFIEETETSITVYASRDNVSPVLMSRFDKIEKTDDIKLGYGLFSNYIEEQQGKETKDASSEREFASICCEKLKSFLLYRKLNTSIIARVGNYI